MAYHVFYMGLFYGSYAPDKKRPWALPRDMPDGAYIYVVNTEAWYLSDHTPVLLDHVPKELKAWVLILE